MDKFKDLTEEEEREIMAFSDEDGWISTDNLERERAFWMQAARNTLDGKRERISISIPLRDLARLKTRAAEEGMPYQTLINSILHKYVEQG